MIIPFLYINYTDPYALEQYLANLGVFYRPRRNPPGDDSLLKRYLNIIIGQARALGWDLSKRYDGWKPETLSTGLRQLSLNDATKLIQNQAKLISSFAPTTKCKKLDGTEITLPMVPMLNKQKEVHWGIPTFWEGKGKAKKYYVLGKGLEKIYTRTVTKKRGYKRYTDADCTEYGGVIYSEARARAAFSVWPVPFIPREWADEYKYSSLLKEFDGGVISIIDNKPSHVVAPQGVVEFDDLDAYPTAPDIKDVYKHGDEEVEELPFDPNSTDPYEWQKLAIERWVDNDFRGLVEACTGSGKTRLCTDAIKRVLEEMPGTHVSIVVPKIALLNQWYDEIVKDLEEWYEEDMKFGRLKANLSRHGGNFKNKEIKQIAIYVINTAKDVLPELKTNHPELPSLHFLIVDEAHRSTSQTFKDIYLCEPDYRLGVTATFPEDIKRYEILRDNIGKVICHYRYAHALLKGIISPFELTFLETILTPDEMKPYEELTTKIKEFARIADRESKGDAPEEPGEEFADAAEKYRKKQEKDKKKGEKKESFAVRMMKILGGARARISWSAVNRLGCALHYISKSLDKGKKVIVFHKSTDGAAALFNLLQNRGYEIGIYHSSQGAHISANYLQAFKNNKIRCLLSVESLLEGLNVPDADVGIAVAADQSRIKIIQSLGRVLRVNPENPLKEYYLITVGPDKEAGKLLPWVANAFKDKEVKAKFINSLLNKEGDSICPVETIECEFTPMDDVEKLHTEAGLPMNKYVIREAEKGNEIKEGKVEVQHPQWALRPRKRGETQQRRRRNPRRGARRSKAQKEHPKQTQTPFANWLEGGHEADTPLQKQRKRVIALEAQRDAAARRADKLMDKLMQDRGSDFTHFMEGDDPLEFTDDKDTGNDTKQRRRRY